MARLYSACTGQNVAPVRDDIARQCNAQLIIDYDGRNRLPMFNPRQQREVMANQYAIGPNHQGNSH